MSQQPKPSSSETASGSRRSNGPTISIENVELLEADRQQDKKRSSRGSRQEEAAQAAKLGTSAFQPNGVPPAGAYGAFPSLETGGAPAPPYGSIQPPGPQGQQQQPPLPADQANNYYYHSGFPPAPGAPPQGPPPHYGMPYQNFYANPAPQQGNPYPFPAGQQAAPANEFTNIMSAPPPSTASFETGAVVGGGYGSIGAPPANLMDLSGSSNRGQGALTIDDIERTFNAVVNQHYEASDRKSGEGNAARARAPSPTAGSSQSPAHSGSRKTAHRRSGSESSAGRRQHRRSASGGNLPPVGPRSDRSPAPSGANRKRPDAPRTRSYSGTLLPGQGGVPQIRRSFSRGNSASDLQSVGAESVASRHSIVSDISKSALFQGVTDEGHVQLHFPYEAVRLVNHKDLEAGKLYMQEIPAASYEAYHVAAEEATAWEHRLDNDNRCSNKNQLLPPTYYAIRVDDDLYRRVVDEIAESHQMPCGLFFCGHHEDVSHPSVLIAAVAVAILFAGMAYVAFVAQA